MLPDKDAREFDLIFDVKSDGWFNLLHTIGNMPLGATVAFSSIAGRFGNAGQTDYSSANDLLCKITSSFRSTRPATRAIAIDWTAWGGIGMATRGSIPKMMEAAGIDMLPPDAGIPLIRRELTAGATRGEVVIGQRLGVLMNEFDPTGGLDVDKARTILQKTAHGPMIGTVASMTLQGGLSIETTLDTAVQPLLRDHQIEGTPLLPGVMGIEGFAEAALCLLPGWHVEAVENVNFLSPVKFYRNQPRTLTVEAIIRPMGDILVAECRLLGRRTLPNQMEPQVTTHFTGRVRLSSTVLQPVTRPRPNSPAGATITAQDVYRVYFHGPAYRVVEQAWWDGARMTGLMAKNLPGNHHPPDLPTIMSPRLIELCFQSAGLWELAFQGQLGLPQHVEEVCVLRSPEIAAGPLYALVTPQPSQFEVEVIDADGNIYLQLKGYGTVALPRGADANALQALQALTSLQTAA